MAAFFRSVHRFLSQPKKLRDTFAVALDCLLFRLRFGFIAKCGLSPDPRRRVYFVSLVDWIAQVKIEGLLGVALRQQGVTPVAVTYSTSKWAQKYFRALGIRDFIFINEILDDLAKDADIATARAMIAENRTFAGLLQLEFEGVRIGWSVLSWIVRVMKNSACRFEDPEVQQKLEDTIVDSIRMVRAARKVFADERPEAVLFLEKGYTPYGEIYSCALEKDLNVIQFVHSQRPEALALKRYTKHNADLHPFSVSPSTWERIRNTPINEEGIMAELRASYEVGTWFDRKNLLRSRVKEKAEVTEQLGLDPKKKTAVIFSHILWDASFFYGTSLFEDYEQWLVETVKVACANDAVNWIIKLHPDYLWKMQREGDKGDPRDLAVMALGIGRLPSYVHIVRPDTDISTLSFYELADYCITVRGTPGIEAPCFGIPALTAGTGRYSHLGFTNDSETKVEYLEKLRRIQDIPPLSPETISLARRHAHAIFDLLPFPFHTFILVKNPRKWGHPLDHNVRIFAKSCRDIEGATDFRAFADWVLRSREPDLLSELSSIGLHVG